MDRNQLRSALLKSSARPRRPLDLGDGVTVDLLDPVYDDIAGLKRTYENKPIEGGLWLVTRLCVVPGSDTKILDHTDIADLMGRPIGGWLKVAMDAVGARVKELTDMGNANSTPANTSST